MCFFQFQAVFGEIWQNRVSAPPLCGWRHHLGEILDPPLISIRQMWVLGFKLNYQWRTRRATLRSGKICKIILAPLYEETWKRP